MLTKTGYVTMAFAAPVGFRDAAAPGGIREEEQLNVTLKALGDEKEYQCNLAINDKTVGQLEHVGEVVVAPDHGRVVATGTPDQLKAKTGGQVLQVAPADSARMAEVTALMTELIRGEVGADAENGVATAQVGDSALGRHVFRELDDRGIELAEFALRKPSMDEVFFTLTGRRASDDDSGPRELEGSTR